MFIFIFCTIYFIFIAFIIHISSAHLYSFKNFIFTNTTDKNRIIIDSGSNSSYGINSMMIENHFNKLTINLADNAAVTIKTKLHRINQLAHSGDIVIFPLEYIYYIDDHGLDIFYDSIFFEAHHYFDYFTFFEKINFIFNIPSSSVFNAILRNYKDKTNFKNNLEAFTIKNTHIIYDFMNEFKNGQRGDYKYLGKDPIEPNMQPCQEYIFNKDRNKTAKIGEIFKANLNFIKEIKKNKKIEFIFTYPAVAGGEECYSSTDSYGKHFHSFLKDIKKYIEKNGFEFIGSYQDSYFTDNFMNDTWFHLIPEARDIRTQKLIQNLEKSKLAQKLHEGGY